MALETHLVLDQTPAGVSPGALMPKSQHRGGNAVSATAGKALSAPPKAPGPCEGPQRTPQEPGATMGRADGQTDGSERRAHAKSRCPHNKPCNRLNAMSSALSVQTHEMRAEGTTLAHGDAFPRPGSLRCSRADIGVFLVAGCRALPRAHRPLSFSS